MIMKHYIESLVNTITMYRLVLYGLCAIALVALILSAVGQLGLPILGLLSSLGILIVASYVTSRFCAWTFSTTHNRESWLITALILFLIIPPAITVQHYIITALVAALAMASKYLLAWRGKHIFNPAAIAVVLVGAVNAMHAIWWVATPLLLPVVAVVSILVVAKTRRYAMATTFTVVALLTSAIVALISGFPITDALTQDILSGPLIFFAAILLTEPLTSPATRKWQIVYAALVGILYSSQLEWISNPEAALIIGNLLAFAVSLRQAPTFNIQKVVEIGPRIYEILVAPTKPFHFKPGQYLELTLPHKHQDTKGTRRMFSIASAPHEKFIRFGITHGKDISSFKKALLDSEGKPVRATQLGGDFTLPHSTKEPLLLMAGGIGITPFRAMLSDLIERKEKRDIILFYGAATVDAIAYQDILDQAERRIGLTVVPIIAEPPKDWKGESGFVRVSLLHRYVPDFRNRKIYISGPPQMVDSLKKQLRQKGVARSHIKTDHFSGY